MRSNVANTYMERDETNLNEYLAFLRRRRGPFLAVALSLSAVAVTIALWLPSVYRSTATILIEHQEIPQHLVRSTVTTYADQRIQVISQRVMTSANLRGIIEKYDLYSDTDGQEVGQGTVARLRNAIRVEMISAEVIDPRRGRPTQATIAFTLSFEGPSADLAQQVTSELASLYLNENAKIRRKMTSETSEFLSDEAKKIKAQVSTLEQELAEFKEQNAEQLPEMMGLYLRLVDQTERDILEVERQIGAEKENRIYLRSQLAQLSPNDTMMRVGDERLLGPAERLAMLERQYVSLSARYAADHPDLIRVRNEMTALREKLGVAASSKKLSGGTRTAAADGRVGGDREDQAPGNPAYLEAQARLKMAVSELKALAAKRERLVAKLASYKERLARVPQVEREYRSLTREYENALEKYRNVKAKETSAQLAQSLEVERMAERFTLIEPPRVAAGPVKPRRMLIALLGFTLSLGGGIGAAAIAEAMDESVRGARMLSRLAGQAPLAVIPFVETRGDRARRALKGLLFTIFLILTLLSVIAALTEDVTLADAMRLLLPSNVED